MSTTTAETEAAQRKPVVKLQRQFVSYWVYKVAPEWRLLNLELKEAGKRAFEKVINDYSESKRAQILTYTTMGMRADGDFLLWIITTELDVLQQLATDLVSTELGHYLTKTHSFLSMTKRSMYLDRFNPEHPADRVHLIPGKYKYFFVYPFVKKRDWYLLSQEERQKMMDEHIQAGMRYPSVKLNTAYSFGLDDQEFMVAFETDQPSDFLDLVQELRESQASGYTLRDTPLITCIAKDIKGMLDSLGS